MYLKYDKTDISVAFHYWKYQFYQVCHFAIDWYCGKPNDNDEPSQTSVQKWLGIKLINNQRSGDIGCLWNGSTTL